MQILIFLVLIFALWSKLTKFFKNIAERTELGGGDKEDNETDIEQEVYEEIKDKLEKEIIESEDIDQIKQKVAKLNKIEKKYKKKLLEWHQLSARGLTCSLVWAGPQEKG